MRRIITYAVDEDGDVVSRVGDEVAIPILDYEGMKPENGYAMKYNLEKSPMSSVIATGEIRGWTWTKKIPVEIKNKHRRFWGMKPLAE